MNQLYDTIGSLQNQYQRKSQAKAKSAFEIFSLKLGSKLFEKLNFDSSNKFFRFKKSEYMQGHQVVEYFNKVFVKKSNVQMRRKWHIKDKFALFWIISKYCQLQF